jgi:hypothetical protein
MTKLATIVRDAIGCLGLGLIAAGTGMVYLPAGFIVCGLAMAGAAWWHARVHG